jgi:hypothetical protein
MKTANPEIDHVRERLSKFTARWDSIADEVAIATIHYNPCGFRRLRQTFEEWKPTLGPLEKCLRVIELVFDDDEPEIEGSTVIRGTRHANALWQKEPLVNVALSSLPESISYFAWIDHDIVFHDPDWLPKACKMIDDGAIAVQLMSRIEYLNRDHIAIQKRPSYVSRSKSKKPFGNPGGAWMADRRYMDAIGGLNCDNIVGGGDQVFLDGLLGRYGHHISCYPDRLSDSVRDWIRMANFKTAGRPVRHLPGSAMHLWHGDRRRRQYGTRNEILRNADFDPTTDSRINENGILEWCSDKPRMHRQVRRYFQRRREDG